MMLLDSHSTKSPSWMTGTMALGFKARKAGSVVSRKPVPQSSRSNGRRSSAQAHSTLRTLMDEAFPRIFSMSRAPGALVG
ncbi:hypothetical protein D9M70_578940 [compost metagenome]